MATKCEQGLLLESFRQVLSLERLGLADEPHSALLAER
jgi:hypothetical protein